MATIRDTAMGLIASMLSLEELTATAKILLIVLHCYTDSEEKCWLSDYEIARLMGMHPKSIQKLLKELLKRKHINKIYDESRKRYLIPLAYTWEKPLDSVEVEK